MLTPEEHSNAIETQWREDEKRLRDELEAEVRQLRDGIRRLADGWWDEEAEEWRHPDGYCDPDVWTIGNQEDSAYIVSQVAQNNRARDLYRLLGEDR